MAERNKFAKKVYSEDGKSVVFEFEDKINVTVNVSDFPPDIVTHLTQHGIGQKLGDSYAKAGVDSPEAARDEVETLIAQLAAGSWRMPTEGAGPKAGQTVRALFNLIERGAQSPAKSDTAKLASHICGSFLHIDGALDSVDMKAVTGAWASLSDEVKKKLTGSEQVLNEVIAMKAASAKAAPSLMA